MKFISNHIIKFVQKLKMNLMNDEVDSVLTSKKSIWKNILKFKCNKDDISLLINCLLCVSLINMIKTI